MAGVDVAVDVRIGLVPDVCAHQSVPQPHDPPHGSRNASEPCTPPSSPQAPRAMTRMAWGGPAVLRGMPWDSTEDPAFVSSEGLDETCDVSWDTLICENPCVSNYLSSSKMRELIFQISDAVGPELGEEARRASKGYQRDKGAFTIETVHVNAFSSGKRHLHRCKSDIVLMQETSALKGQVASRERTLFSSVPYRVTQQGRTSSVVTTATLRRHPVWEDKEFGSLVWDHRVHVISVVVPNFGVVDVYNVYFVTGIGLTGENLDIWRSIVLRIKARKAPYIVGGDFNINPLDLHISGIPSLIWAKGGELVKSLLDHYRPPRR